jgi:hypothetical protein
MRTAAAAAAVDDDEEDDSRWGSQVPSVRELNSTFLRKQLITSEQSNGDISIQFCVDELHCYRPRSL